MAKKMSADPGPGHPGPDPNTYLKHHRAALESGRALGEAQSAHQNTLKAAKKDGVDIDVLKALIRLQKQDPTEVSLHFQTLARYAAWTGKPLGFQADLLAGAGDHQGPDDDAVAEFTLAEVLQQGYTDATQGAPIDNNPHPVGTDMAAEWAKGWHRGAEFMSSAGKVKDPPARPRNRRGAVNGVQAGA